MLVVNRAALGKPAVKGSDSWCPEVTRPLHTQRVAYLTSEALFPPSPRSIDSAFGPSVLRFSARRRGAAILNVGELPVLPPALGPLCVIMQS
jgi:hypothetical protein